MSIAGYTPGPDERTNVLNNAISPGYFKAMGIPILMGRDFDDRDERLEPPRDGAAVPRGHCERGVREEVLRRPESNRWTHRIRQQPEYANAY